MDTVTLYRIRRHLDYHVDLVAREIGISALVLSEVADCIVLFVVRAIEKGFLPGYAIMLTHEGNHVRRKR